MINMINNPSPLHPGKKLPIIEPNMDHVQLEKILQEMEASNHDFNYL